MALPKHSPGSVARELTSFNALTAALYDMERNTGCLGA